MNRSSNNEVWVVFGAGDETRTRDIQLGRLALYQLSYSRVSTMVPAPRAGDVWRAPFHAATLRRIAATGIAVERIDVQHELDMHYVGQTHTIAVPLGTTAQGAAPQLTEDSVRAAFETVYDASFGRLLRGLPIAIASLRVSAIGHRPAFDASLFAPDPTASLDRAALGLRPVWFDGDWRDTRVWSRLDLPVGAGIEGPAILEQPDATTVIEPGLIVLSVGALLPRVIRMTCLLSGVTRIWEAVDSA